MFYSGSHNKVGGGGGRGWEVKGERDLILQSAVFYSGSHNKEGGGGVR